MSWEWGRSRWGIDTAWGGTLTRFDAYGTARDAVLAAQESGDSQALKTAHAALRQAEAACKPEFDKAWQANIDTVQDATAAVVAAVREQARVEVECGNAARARNPSYPLLNAAEFDRVRAAATVTDQARVALAAARVAFKAGVTVEQLEAVA